MTPITESKGYETFRFSKTSIIMGLFRSLSRHTPNMTAIVSTYTPEGFIVGADGLRISETTGQVTSTSVQKLFPFISENIRAIYGWCGTTQMFGEAGDCLFDFIGISEPLFTAAACLESNDLPSFLRRIQIGIYELTSKSKLVKGGQSDGIGPNAEVARLFIAGYFYGDAFIADIGLRLENFTIVLPKIKSLCYPLRKSVEIFSGSRLAHVGFETASPNNRQEALSFVTDYIKACIEKPDYGQQFGGDVHIAELTLDSFSWIQPPSSSQGGTPALDQ